MPSQLKLLAPVSERERALPPVFACSWSTHGLEAAWASVTGELDIATTPQLEQTLRDCLAAARLVVLDLHELTFIGSAGIAAIVSASIHARRNGRRLVLLRGVPAVELVFTLTGGFRDVEIVDLAPTQPAGPGRHTCGQQDIDEE